MRRTHPTGSYLLLIAACCGWMLLQTRTVSAQNQGGVPANPLGPFTESVERRRAEQELRSLPLKLRERRERNLADPKILEQMNEDFIEIQTIRAGMVKIFASGAVMQPEALHKAAREVKRRGTRLRSMLALTEEISTRQLPSDPRPTLESVNDRAFKLCIEISRFTENPLFKTTSAITIKHAKEASRALDAVIVLAGLVEKEARKLKSD
jgi:hypothetical protein